MNPLTPAARWSPAIRSRRPFIGQAAPADIVTVIVYKDGQALAGVPVEIMFQNGESKTGTTDAGGTFVSSYTQAQRGQGTVRIAPPEGVEDLGEGTAQGIGLTGGPAEVKFQTVGVGGASPLVGIGVAGALYALVLAAF
jgi:hypothetical protein